MANPYLLPNPSVISFSGGRTSAYMLRKILDAFGGVLPEWVKVVFCNTGKEREETLEFVERCSQRWDVPITWLEYRWEPGRHYFVVVDFASASRNGEPFEFAIKARSFLPNPIMRFCTAETKIRTTNRYVRQTLVLEEYSNAIGLRGDETNRVERMRQRRQRRTVNTLWGEETTTIRGADLPPGESPIFPLHDAGVGVEDVMEFWRSNDFDLALRQDEGNCDLCFLKGAKKILAIMKDRPDLAEWWAEKEREAVSFSKKPTGATFRNDRPSYAELLAIAQGKEEGPGWLWSDKQDGSCGEVDECRCTD